jgi:predicted enzyme related to lactoylglutathione lyase
VTGGYWRLEGECKSFFRSAPQFYSRASIPFSMHGQFVWYELTTPDVGAAQKFYPRFTGWGLQPFDKDYMMFTTGGTPIAGVFQLSEEMRQQGVPPNWMPYVEANNIDETAAKATSLGGRVVHGPMDVAGAGRLAILQDPQGATFGIYKSASPNAGAWDGTAVVGRFSWHELMTTDASAAFDFYRGLFGWDRNGEMDMGGGQMYSMYGTGEKMYGGMYNRTADMASMHPFWMIYIHVADVGKAVATAVKAGGTVHRPQMDIPGGSIAILGDPQGAGFALHHVNAQPVAASTASRPAAKKASKPAAKPASKPAAKKASKTVAKSAKKKTVAAKKSAKPAARKPAGKKPAKAATRLRAKAVKTKSAKPKAKAKPNVRAKARRRL